MVGKTSGTPEYPLAAFAKSLCLPFIAVGRRLWKHPFGTIKRGWGYIHTLLKGMKKVKGEFSLIFLSYNTIRSMSVFGVL